MRMNSRFSIIVAMAVLLLLASSSAQAASGMLDEVLVSRQGDAAKLEMQFACRNRYVDHGPSTRSDRVRISLARVDDCELSANATPRRDLRRPAGRELAYLRQVELVYDAEGGVLVLHFEQPVNVRVQQGGNLNRLVVEVEVGAAGSELSPQQRARAEDRARLATARVFTTPAPAAQGAYAINLESSLQPVDATRVDTSRLPDDLQLYTTRIVVADQTWHRLRLGFLASEADAERVLVQLQQIYPNAWVARVGDDEHAAAAARPLVAPTAAASRPAPTPVGDELTAQQLADLAGQGRAAMQAGDNDRAVQIYTRILREPENENSRQAQEYLGLSRERNGQAAHAVAEYRRYLMLYPEGDDAARVRQRLAGLVAIDELRADPAQVFRRREVANRWDVYGGISQYYRQDQSRFGDQDSVTSQSSVLTDLDLVARRRGDRFDLSSRATLGNLYDLLSENEGPGTSTRIYFMYADLVDSRWDTSVRVGRQSLRHSGVLGRFDGAQVAWQWRPNTRFNFVTGFPVDSSAASMNTDRFFYGISADQSNVFDLFDLNLFYNNQEFDGIDERQAVGGEMRYYDDARSLVSLIDYDLSYGEINSFVVLGNWNFANRVTVNAMLDTRKTPLLTTRNALIGQPFTSLDELVQSIGEAQVRQLARDRTGDMQTVSLGVSTPLFDRFQVNADVTMVDYAGTPASGDVPSIPDVSGDLYYSLTLIGSGLLLEGDTSVFGLGYVDSSNASTMTFTVDTRYPVTRGLRLNPRVRVSLREIIRTQSDQWIAAPSLRMLYRFARRYQLELEVGGEWSSQKTAGDSFDYNTYFIYAGYRTDF
jgi:tetratricopeptide (TPR) repeat protein